MSNLIDLDGLDLGSLDEKGKPVETRLKDVKSAVGLFATLLKADEKSAVNRARIDSMFDGAAPYSQSQLAASGQGLKTNLNFGEAQRLLDISLSAYVDLYSSLERLVEVKSTTGEKSEQGPKEDVVAEELTNLFRVLNVAPNECVTGVMFDVFQVLEVAGVGQQVEVHDAHRWVFAEQSPDHVGTDEASAACDKDGCKRAGRSHENGVGQPEVRDSNR